MLAAAAATKSSGFSFGAKPAAGAAGMASMLGREGAVSSVDDDGDVRVHGKCWNPALLERVAAAGFGGFGQPAAAGTAAASTGFGGMAPAMPSTGGTAVVPELAAPAFAAGASEAGPTLCHLTSPHLQ